MRIPLLAALALAAPTASAQTDEDRLVLYFDPDGNHEAISEIATLFNQYLTQQEARLKFQAVLRQTDLEKKLESGAAAFVIVASSFLPASERFELEPLLVPTWKGDPFYTKVLVDLGEGEPGRLSASVIAATRGSGESAGAEDRILAMLQRANVDVSGAQVMLVPKDIDAAMATQLFGQAQAALVTRSSIEYVKAQFPKLPALREVYETPRILRSPLCQVGGRAKPIEAGGLLLLFPGLRRAEIELRRMIDQQLLFVFEKMAQDPVGRRALLRMGIDGWVPYTQEMTKP